MEAQADATHCGIIVILLVQLSHEELGVKGGNIGVLPIPMLALS